MKLAFPTGWGTRRPIDSPTLRGQAYGDVDEELLDHVGRWLAEARVDGGEDLRAGRVFRCGELVAKFFREKHRWRTHFRAAGALRAAELSFEILPIRSPRPLLAVEGRGPLRDRPSLLVSEFVHGPLLGEVWDEDERARADLPRFLAEMHRRNVLHGDLHPMNLIRSGDDWVVLDLTALRHGLHRMFRQRLILGQWTRLVAYLQDPERLEQAFRAYHAEGLLRGGADALWRRVTERAERFARRPGTMRADRVRRGAPIVAAGTDTKASASS